MYNSEYIEFRVMLTQYIENSSPLAHVSDAVFQTKLATIFHVGQVIYNCIIAEPHSAPK